MSLHARRWDGGNPPFLLVHGLASNARMWDGVAERLATAGHQVVAVDLRGHGRSDKPDHGYAVPDVADDLAAVIDALGWRDVVLAGQSWGGNVVVELAARVPWRVRAVAAIDGGTIELSRRFATWDDCAAALAPPRTEGTPLAQMEATMRHLYPDWPESGIEGALGNWEVREDGTVAPWLTGPRHMAVLRGLWNHHPSVRFPSLTVPVLLLPVETDSQWELDKQDDVTRAAAAGPTVRVQWLQGHHDIHAQRPDVVAALLGELAR